MPDEGVTDGFEVARVPPGQPGPRASQTARGQALVRVRRRRALGALALLVIALVNLVGVFMPRTWRELREINAAVGIEASFTARSLLALFGFVALALVRSVRAGNRSAWLSAIALGVLSVVSQLYRDATLWPALVCALAVIVLLADPRAYRIRSALRLRRLALPTVLAVLAAGSTVLVEDVRGLPELSIGGWAGLVVRSVLFLPTGVQPRSEIAVAYLDSLRLVGGLMWLSLVIAVAGFVRPGRIGRAERLRSQEYMARHGRFSSTPLAMLPDNDLLWLDDATIIGGRFSLGAFVAVGGAVSEDDDEKRSLESFLGACERWGVLPVIVDAAPATARAATEVGLKALKLGEEAFIDAGEFTLAGKQRANVRHSAKRAQRDGVTVVHYTADRSTDAIDGQLQQISDAWLASKHGPELGFTLGRLDLEQLETQEVFVALAVDGSAVAFVNWMPYDASRCAVLDLMRRGAAAPPGVMELLISQSIVELRESGYQTLSLGGVPLASTSGREGRLERIMEWMYDNGGSIYEAKSLFAFKRKFDPRWEPMYLIYPAGADLPRVTAAIGRAFLPRIDFWRRDK